MVGADALRARIEAYAWPHGGVEVVRAKRGYTLYSRRMGGPVARLRPTDEEDRVQVPVVASRRLGHPRRLRSRHSAA